MPTAKRAFITGITGQDGSYLTEFLLGKGYEVHGLSRRPMSASLINIVHLDGKITLHVGDMTDGSRLSSLVEEIRPHEIYNLAAQSNVRISFDEPANTSNVVGLGAVRLLEAVRKSRQDIRFYQASSSEMFGFVDTVPQREDTPFNPQSPYAAAKVYAHQNVVNYRKGYGIHASCGIMFNHESPRRGENFLTRKVTRAVARIAKGSLDKLRLGNLKAERDWGYAPEYVEAMWLMLQQDKPDDYVIATGESHSVEEFVAAAFDLVRCDWREFIVIDQTNFRPTEVPVLEGDANKARRILGWCPKTSFIDLVRTMVLADLDGR